MYKRQPYIIGASFSIEENKDSRYLVGNKGLYMINVVSREIAPDLTSYSGYKNSLRENEKLRINSKVFDALEMSSEIEDNRHLYY